MCLTHMAFICAAICRQCEAKGQGNHNDALAVSSKVVREAAGSATRESYYLEIILVPKFQSATRLRATQATEILAGAGAGCLKGCRGVVMSECHKSNSVSSATKAADTGDEGDRAEERWSEEPVTHDITLLPPSSLDLPLRGMDWASWDCFLLCRATPAQRRLLLGAGTGCYRGCTRVRDEGHAEHRAELQNMLRLVRRGNMARLLAGRLFSISHLASLGSKNGIDHPSSAASHVYDANSRNMGIDHPGSAAFHFQMPTVGPWISYGVIMRRMGAYR
ncbi:hypothetical protein B0H14DRAFT_2599762 [Mycena olivaceomarginata]|nr:hypothetical protein B0H14DRAFT_2599762 [Mycena olivaceomarginata]